MFRERTMEVSAPRTVPTQKQTFTLLFFSFALSCPFKHAILAVYLFVLVRTCFSFCCCCFCLSKSDISKVAGFKENLTQKCLLCSDNLLFQIHMCCIYAIKSARIGRNEIKMEAPGPALSVRWFVFPSNSETPEKAVS